MSNTNNIVVAGIIVAGLAVISFFGSQKAGEYIKNQAVDACMKTASFETTTGSEGNSAVLVEPLKKWYDTCMTEKGYIK